jgi:hypothetical protein
LSGGVGRQLAFRALADGLIKGILSICAFWLHLSLW